MRDEKLLESAFETPFQSFGGEELYPGIQAKAARLCYGLVKNHAMLDGNTITHFICNCNEIHVSDDWGSQKALMFSPTMLREMIVPQHKRIVSECKKRGVLTNLHSNGCIVPALDSIVEIGYERN